MVLLSCAYCGFSLLLFLSTMVVVFRFFHPRRFMFFLFAKEVTPCGGAETLIPRDYFKTCSFLSKLSFRGMHKKPSLFSNHYFGSKGFQADYEKLKIKSKQKTSSQISRISSLAISQRLTSAVLNIKNCVVITPGRHAIKQKMIAQFQKISMPNHGQLPCLNPSLPSEIPKCITPHALRIP